MAVCVLSRRADVQQQLLLDIAGTAAVVQVAVEHGNVAALSQMRREVPAVAQLPAGFGSDLL